MDIYKYTIISDTLRKITKKRRFSGDSGVGSSGGHSEPYLTPATTITTTGNVTAASSVPSATAPDTGFTSR